MNNFKFVLLCQIFIVNYIGGEEFCLFETFNPQCQNDELIIIHEASFGRMRFGRCITETQGIGLVNDPKYIGCFTDVTSFVSKKCFGKRECEIKIPDLKVVTESVCYAELYMYLDVSYSCLRVAQDNRQCAITLNSDRELHVFPTSLKSSSTCGSKDFPWKVEAYKGQAINISLLINESDTSKSNFDHEPKVCLNNLFESYIVDSNEKRKVPICGNGRLGNSLFFVTSSNTVHIFFNPKKSEDKLISEYGILRLTATGCSDLIPPADAWLKRTENEATIGCYSTRLRWQFKCLGQRWIGVIGNCSYASINNDKLNVHLVEKSSKEGQPQVVAIVIICIVGITLCTVISCLGIVCFKRYNAKNKLATKLFHQRQSTLRPQNDNLKSGQTCLDNGIPEMVKSGLPVYSDCEFGQNGKYQVGNNQYFVLDSEYEKKDTSN